MSRTGWIIFGVIAIVIILIVVIVVIYYITQIGAIVSTPFAPSGSVVQLKNAQTGGLLGICTIGTSIACNEGARSGDYASTSPNQSNPDTMKWTVSVDPTTQFVALQNVSTGKYLGNSENQCSQGSITGTLLSVELQNVEDPTLNNAGWFGSVISSANSTQLFVLNKTANNFIGTQNNNSFSNTCLQMVSDGFLQAEANQTNWQVTILNQ